MGLRTPCAMPPRALAGVDGWALPGTALKGREAARHLHRQSNRPIGRDIREGPGLYHRNNYLPPGCRHTRPAGPDHRQRRPLPPPAARRCPTSAAACRPVIGLGRICHGPCPRAVAPPRRVSGGAVCGSRCGPAMAQRADERGSFRTSTFCRPSTNSWDRLTVGE